MMTLYNYQSSLKALNNNIMILIIIVIKTIILDVTVPRYKRIGEKENDKVEKYEELKREIAKIWNKRTLHVVPIVMGLLGSVAKNCDKLGTSTSIHCSKNSHY